MTKAELIKAIETLSDDTEIYMIENYEDLDSSDEYRLHSVAVISEMDSSPIICLR